MTVRDIVILGCSSQQPTRLRNHGAYLVRWNDEGLLFDPGEGTQRQFIFANVAPTVVTRIFVSHFHGDHCLGLGSMLMRLNLDKVTHPIHCYYPASGKRYFDRLRYGTIYHEIINVIEHPVSQPGLVHDDGKFRIEAIELEHGVDNLGWRITEPDTRKFDRIKLQSYGIKGPMVRDLEEKGFLLVNDQNVRIDDVSQIRKGDSLAVVIDTRYCQNAIDIARDAEVLICESTYLEEHEDLARKHYHLTARQAATIAKQAGAKKLILTHFSARYQNLRPFEEEAKAIFPNTYVADDLLTFPFPKNH
ncbi:MAG: ribonuclease Z [Chlamydiales bacterium 38-26]|nr:ribonuclease Z [Chlamydiales bacterium]OJV07843.1 MAG: ribonuclease Z [Chlamydiales bacterium 38-26]